MSYRRTDTVQLNKRFESDQIKVHQNRGDGTALCAVGTQYPNPADWNELGAGEVNCDLCAASMKEPEARGGSRLRMRSRPGYLHAPIESEQLVREQNIRDLSLDERIALRKQRGKS